MNSANIISQLESNIYVFQGLFTNIPEELILWRNMHEKWNLLEIICHLYDEERDDFGLRLKHVLENPAQPLPPTDPVGWVTGRNYSSKIFSNVLNDFLKERKDTLKWLRSIKADHFENTYMHPKYGPLSGNFFLSNWLAHDYLHFRQIVKLKFDYIAFSTGHKLDYAGNW